MQWRIQDDPLSRWYDLGEELYAGGLGLLTVRQAARPQLCGCGCTVQTGDAFVSSTQSGPHVMTHTTCQNHALRPIELRTHDFAEPAATGNQGTVTKV